MIVRGEDGQYHKQRVLKQGDIGLYFRGVESTRKKISKV